jgi:phosphatidylglycerol---prolipoprotein diacylglyceryl transferase
MPPGGVFSLASMLVHSLLEIAGSAAGVLVYAFLRRREGDPVDDRARLSVLAGAAIGAMLGARLLWWIGEPGLPLSQLFAGKTIVGGLIGGLIGVELAKKRIGVRTSTGDLFVYPLITAIVIGRIGCFLSGPADRTHGLATDLPWGLAVGDGIRRHPVALYEIAFLLALVPLLRNVRFPGDRFRAFMLSYLMFRLLVDFLKPYPQATFLGLTAIQCACVLGVAYYVSVFARRELATT